MSVETRDILSYIDKQIELKMKVTVREAARHFGLSRQQFANNFRREIHVSPKKYIEQREFLYWKHYLAQNRDRGLNQIYQELGACPRTFFRRIKKFSCHNPRNYRDLLYIRAQFGRV